MSSNKLFTYEKKVTISLRVYCLYDAVSCDLFFTIRYEYLWILPNQKYKTYHFLHSGTVSCCKKIKHFKLNNRRKEEGKQ